MAPLNDNKDHDKKVKTSTNRAADDPRSTGDNTVQDGTGIEQEDHEQKSYDRNDTQQEFTDDATPNITPDIRTGNTDPQSSYH